MASVEFINKRIAGKESEIEKLKKKLTRIEKAEASNWENNPYWYSESDKQQTLRYIDRAEKALDDYKKELEIAIEKENSRNVQVIIDFLDMWKEKVTEYYEKGLKEAYKLYSDYIDKARKLESCVYGSDEYYDAKIEKENAYSEYHNKLYGYFRDYTDDEKARAKSMGRFLYGNVKVRDGELEYVKGYFSTKGVEHSMAVLAKDLDKEAKAMYDDIIERTNKIVGQITDVSYLEVNAKGNLDGYIIGTRGKAKVETIGAGGYNIQRFHFRTLIKPMK